MTFTTRPYLKYLLPLPVIFGVSLFILIFHDYNTKTTTQQNAAIWVSLIILIFFFGLPYWTFKYFKIIEFKNGLWTVKYPYLRRTVTVDRASIDRIELIENISGRGVPAHRQINIRVKDSSSVYINSLETKDFDKLLRLMTADFKDLIKQSDFWTGTKSKR